jgi:hypothetical protein
MIGRGGGIRTHDLFVPKPFLPIPIETLFNSFLKNYVDFVSLYKSFTGSYLSEKISNFLDQIENLCPAYAPQASKVPL